MLFTHRGYIANYQGSPVYVVPEEEYEMKDPNMIYVLWKENTDQFLMVKGGRIVGTMDDNSNFVVWDRVGDPDFSMAGFYDNLNERRKAYELIQAATGSDKSGLFEK